MQTQRSSDAQLHRDATSLAASSFANAAFGLVAWAIMARLIEPASLGVMTAILAVIMTPALAIATPLGDAFAALLPSADTDRPTLIRHGKRIYAVAALIAGTAAGIATVTTVEEVHQSWSAFVLTAVGTVIFGAYLLENSLLTALGRADMLLATTIGMNLVRLAFLYIFATTSLWHSVELSTIAAAGMLALLIEWKTRRIAQQQRLSDHPNANPHVDHISDYNRYISRSFFIILFGFAIFSITPFFVTNFSSPEQGALFALSLPAIQTLDMVGAAMGTSIVVNASSVDAKEAARMARSILIRATGIVAVVGVAIALLAPVILRALNPTYGDLGATAVIGILCLASIIKTPFSAWGGLQRSQRNLGPLLIVAFAGASVAITGVCLLAPPLGAVGGASALLLSSTTMTVGAAVYTTLVRGSRADQ